MSVIRYTFFSQSIEKEITMIITQTDEMKTDLKPSETLLLFSPPDRESDYWLRAFALETLGRSDTPLNTLSLPGHLLLENKSKLKNFFQKELPVVMRFFRLHLLKAGVAVPKSSEFEELFTVLEVPVSWKVTDPLALRM